MNESDSSVSGTVFKRLYSLEKLSSESGPPLKDVVAFGEVAEYPPVVGNRLVLRFDAGEPTSKIHSYIETSTIEVVNKSPKNDSYEIKTQSGSFYWLTKLF